MFSVKEKLVQKKGGQQREKRKKKKLWTVRRLGRRKESWEKKALLTAMKTLAGAIYLSRQNSFVGYSLSQCRESEQRKDVSLRSAVRSYEATPYAEKS